MKEYIFRALNLNTPFQLFFGLVKRNKYMRYNKRIFTTKYAKNNLRGDQIKIKLTFKRNCNDYGIFSQMTLVNKRIIYKKKKNEF